MGKERKTSLSRKKGFIQYEGCLEDNILLQMAIDDTRRSNKQLRVAWLDLKNAFESVPNNHIFKVAASMIQVIQDLYDGATTSGLSSNGLSETVNIQADVKQDALSAPFSSIQQSNHSLGLKESNVRPAATS